MLLKELSEARGLPGREEAVRSCIRSALPARLSQVAEDRFGNLYVGRNLERAGSPLWLCAHMDEVGFLVTGHDEDGRLSFRPTGSVDARVVLGKPVLVGDEALPGVIGAPAFHLRRGDPKVLDYPELRIDIGAESRAEAQDLAPLGSAVTFATPFAATERTLLGKALDDRLGCYLLLSLLADPTLAEVPFWAVFTAQEETGLRGATAAARRLRPAAALVLEATPAAAPGEEASLTRLGEGPALTVLDRASLPDARWNAELQAAAAAEGIPWQWRRGVGGANDAGALWPEGVAVATVSVPCRYLHGPASVADRLDLEASERLIAAFLRRWREVQP